MSPLDGPTASLYDTLTRRQLLCIGGLSALGLGLGDLAQLRARPTTSAVLQKRRRHACVFLFLFGGPSQIDLWDMKPAAPTSPKRQRHGIVFPDLFARTQRPLRGARLDAAASQMANAYRLTLVAGVGIERSNGFQ